MIRGQDPPLRALSTLRTYAYLLRKVLEADRSRPGVVVSAGTGYALSVPRDALDVAVFEDRYAEAERACAEGDLTRARTLMSAALGLWQGDAMDGAAGPYAEAQRDRLGDRRLSALQVKLELDIELGRATEAAAEPAVLSAAHPLRESLSALLMLALCRCGRQAKALEVFDGTRRLLAEELGIDPGASSGSCINASSRRTLSCCPPGSTRGRRRPATRTRHSPGWPSCRPTCPTSPAGTTRSPCSARC
ncbi:BTAD domain-containing putative transcriptional regulator [Nonomuraea spiralis]|uniref:AfsR/SARP family transcriptional regulator n=1 Tax=Nonomuraea spiralis TaxID=46182 RepID=UPI0037A97CAF